MTNGYHVPGRGPNPLLSTFMTRSDEEYFYCVEVTPTYDRSGQLGTDRMAPILDDVQVVYMAWDTVTVIEEVEVLD